MAIFKEEDIAAFRIDEKIVCNECLTDDEEKDLAQDQIITYHNLENVFAFCDRCKKAIEA